LLLGNGRSGPLPRYHDRAARPFRDGVAQNGRNRFYTVPPSDWLTNKTAGERLGLRPAAVAACAGRERWPMRKPNDTGKAEVEVPGVLLAADPL